MSETPLSNLMKQISKLLPVSKEDVNEGPIETLAGRRGRKAQAVESLKRLRREVIRELLNGAAFIVNTGGSSEDFEKVATEEFGVFSSDPESFYNDLVKRIPESAYAGRESVSSLLDILSRHLEDKANEMDLLSYPQLTFRQQYRKTVKDRADFLDLVKTIINEQMGAEIVGIQAARSIVDTAIEKNHTGKVTPIILSTKDENMVSALTRDLTRLTDRVFLVSAGRTSKAVRSMEGMIHVKEADKDGVEAALTKIKNSMRK